MFETIPVLIPRLIYAATGRRAVPSSSALLFGHTLAYFAIGIGASGPSGVCREITAFPPAVAAGHSRQYNGTTLSSMKV